MGICPDGRTTACTPTLRRSSTSIAPVFNRLRCNRTDPDSDSNGGSVFEASGAYWRTSNYPKHAEGGRGRGGLRVMKNSMKSLVIDKSSTKYKPYQFQTGSYKLWLVLPVAFSFQMDLWLVWRCVIRPNRILWTFWKAHYLFESIWIFLLSYVRAGNFNTASGLLRTRKGIERSESTSFFFFFGACALSFSSLGVKLWEFEGKTIWVETPRYFSPSTSIFTSD